VTEFLILEPTWDGLIFPALSLQRTLSKQHVDPIKKLASDSDRKKLNEKIKDHMLVQGIEGKRLSEMPASEVLKLYNNLADGICASLICYTGCRLNEVEAVEKESWDSGLQNRPVGSKLLVTYIPSHLLNFCFLFSRC
jgi:hypothetical protein